MLDPLPSPEGRSIWIFAAIAAISMHAALGIFVAQNFEDIEAVDLGAPGIEIGLEPASPKVVSAELPPGLNSDASMAAPLVTQSQEAKKSELPRDVPVQAEDPDRLVTENKAEDAQEEKPNTEAQSAPPSEASAAQEATAMPTIEAVKEAPRSITHDPGIGQSAQRLRATWQRELAAHLDRHKKYPVDRTRINADVTLNLVLDRTGKVISATIVTSSGDPAFDEAALSMIRRADPVPAPPTAVADEGLSFTLPVNFRPNTRS